MQAVHSAARSVGVSAVVGAGQHRPVVAEGLCGGINKEIRDKVGGRVRQGNEHGRGRRGGVSGSERVQWSGMEWGGGQMIDNLDRRRARNTAGRERVAKNLNLEGQSLVLL